MASHDANSDAKAEPKRPISAIIIGMAGSGKTTLMQRINTYVHQKKIPSYTINLDPAVKKIPYGANIDIRDTVNYKEVMKQYKLGPNGGILTSLNLFATRFDQVLGFVEKRAADLDHIFIDTPGQIEVFTWSASGTIITESLATSMPTVVVYVVDTPRCSNPVTFMSNMTYACSIMYKTKLPFLVVFNKTDITDHKFAQEWMSDFDSFNAALRADDSYSATLSRSLSLVLDEFYNTLKTVGVSSMTGAGMDEFFEALHAASKEYDEVYKPLIEKQQAEKKKREELRQQAQLAKLKKDIMSSKGQDVVLDASDIKTGKSETKQTKPAPTPTQTTSTTSNDIDNKTTDGNKRNSNDNDNNNDSNSTADGSKMDEISAALKQTNIDDVAASMEQYDDADFEAQEKAEFDSFMKQLKGKSQQ